MVNLSLFQTKKKSNRGKYMEKKTKVIIGIVVAVITVIIVAGLLIVQAIFNQETEKLKQMSEEMATMEVTTKDGEKIELEYYNFDDGRFFLKMPTSFEQMDEETLNLKYNGENPPTFAFANERGTVSISLSLSEAKIKNEQIENFVKTTKEQMQAISDVQKVNIYKKDGRTIGELILVSKAEDTDIYNHMLVFSDKDCLRVINFNCTNELEENWKEVGAFLMKSLMFPVEE